jgi:hypothetical protein
VIASPVEIVVSATIGVDAFGNACTTAKAGAGNVVVVVVDSLVTGAAVDGAAVDGAAVDGASVDGASVDGASVDGASVDGAVVVVVVVVVVVAPGAATCAASRMNHAMAASFIVLTRSLSRPMNMHCVVVGHERSMTEVLPVPVADGSSVHVVPFHVITSEVVEVKYLLPTIKHCVEDTQLSAYVSAPLGLFTFPVSMTGNVTFVQRV